jgi:drug/metabolite transporter (DMT)-like permease
MSNHGHDAEPRSGLVLVVVSAASFGLSGALASGLISTGWTAGAVVLVRLGLGAIVVAPFAVADLRGRWRVLRAHAGLVVLYGAVPMAMAQFAYFSAVSKMAVGPALLIEFTAPAAVVAWLWLRRGERPSPMTLIGAAICAAGLVLVLDLLAGPSLNPIGVAWALVAMVGAASYFLLGSEGIAAVPAIGLAGCGLVAATVLLGVLGATGLLPLHAATASVRYAGVHVAWWVPLLALGAITCGVAYCAGVVGIRRLGSRVASFVGLLEVVSGVVWAWLLLAQVPGAVQLGGGVLLLAGIVVVRLGERAGPSAGSGDLGAEGGAAGAPQRLAVAAGELPHRALPRALARRRQAGAAQPLREQRSAGHRHERGGESVGVGRGEQPALPVLDE